MAANTYGSFNNSNQGNNYPSNNRRATPVNTNGLITVVGNLGSDVTIRTSRKGNDWATVSVAMSNGHYDGNDWVDEGTTWYDVVLFGDVAHAAAETLRKGQRVIVQGTLSTEDWQGRDGQTHTSLKLTARNIGLTLGNQPKARRS